MKDEAFDVGLIGMMCIGIGCEEGSVTGEDFGSSYTYSVGEVYILWHLQYISYGEVNSTLYPFKIR
ncbi:hypothetical protein DWX33_02470 [Parabacteroides sp. AF19-14]|nr:hypothetical protein DWX33_02470 [Parabacteroides sp. AF19-14]